MTAEVAILNKMAVALAADSAVTSTVGNSQKIYNSVNKLFSLSKFRPVGVMIYGRADLMGVPWESIIKEYRKRLGDVSFNTLEEYVLSFVRFLEAGDGLFPPEHQRGEFIGHVRPYYDYVLDKITKAASTALEKGPLDQASVTAIVAEVITAETKEWDQVGYLPEFSEEDALGVVSDYRSELETLIGAVFERLPLGPEHREQLVRFGGLVFSKDRLPSSTSGLVIAGFGEAELFPSLVEHRCFVVLRNRFVRKRLQTSSVLRDGAFIAPFAQSDMVHTFMNGVDPRYREMVDGYLNAVFKGFPDALLKAMPADKLSPDESAALESKLHEASQAVLKDLSSKVNAYSLERHVRPVVSAVGLLPKGELAEMAESLVNLTSFRQKMSIEAETVGGPIDVAVISKGDGFVWIKRKHYFRAELNHSFFNNYFRLDSKVSEEPSND